MTSVPTTHFDQTCALENPSPGVYERDIDQVFFGWEGQFGGYVLAMVLEACRLQVTNPSHTERMLSMQFLRRFPEGRFRVEVTTEREGRTVTSVSFRAFVDDKLCGLGHALFASVRNAEDYQLAPPPADLTPPADDEEPSPSPIPVLATKRFRYWPRRAEPDAAAPGEVSGWMALTEPGGADERFLMCVADGYTPVFLAVATQPAVGGTIDFTAHFRERPSAAIIDGDEPVHVVLRTARSIQGYVDEDAEIWSADGRLLLQSRQTRYSELLS